MEKNVGNKRNGEHNEDSNLDKEKNDVVMVQNGAEKRNKEKFKRKIIFDGKRNVNRQQRKRQI